MNRWVLMASEADETKLAFFPRRDQRFDRAARGEHALGVVEADYLVDLHQVDHVRLEALERLLELFGRSFRRTPVQLGHQERPLAPPSVRERASHPFLALAVVVIPTIVHEGDA